MANPPADRDLQVALRMKAARYLAGRASADGRAIPLPVGELAENPDLVQNRIGRNRLEEIEQMRVTARPMELEKIAAALGVPADWFVKDQAAGPTEAAVLAEIQRQVAALVKRLGDLSLTPEASRDLLQRLLAGHDQAADQERPGTPRRRDDEGRQGPAAGGGGA